jgi:3-(3-hydroxy-phenyl)propionate hydroxylase
MLVSDVIRDPDPSRMEYSDEACGSRGVDVPVIVVGAGPVGLTCTARLAALGCPTMLVDEEPALRRQGSKACLIQGDVLEILDKVGCAEAIAREGITWNVGRKFVRGKEIETQVYDRPVGYGPFVNISQFRIEQLLLGQVEAAERAEIRWSHRVVGIHQDSEGVTTTCETPDGIREFRSAYVVACDGVRSPIRRLVGAVWERRRYDALFLITDIRAPLPFPHERRFEYDPPFNPGLQFVMHPQPDDVWRMDWQLPPDAPLDDDGKPTDLHERITAVIGDIPYSIEWVSTYCFSCCLVEEMRVGRVFLAGDAAHALPPYGARGMNSGLQDADNLAWKLALVVAGHADKRLLETYHAERHAAARENVRVSEATIKFMAPRGPIQRHARNAVLRLSTFFAPVRAHVNSGRMAEPFRYTSSQSVESSTEGALVGSFAPDLLVSAHGQRTRLRRLLGGDFVLLHFAHCALSAKRFVDEVHMRRVSVPLQTVVVLPGGSKLGNHSLMATVVYDEGTERAAAYRRETENWYLIRPDGHVGAAGRGVDASHVVKVLAKISCSTIRAPWPVRLTPTRSSGSALGLESQPRSVGSSSHRLSAL